MKLESDEKFQEKLTLGLKNDVRNMVNFHPTTQNPKNFYFMSSFWWAHGIFLSKVENALAKNLQSSSVSWQRRMMQNMKRNWLVISKLTWWIGQILIRALQSLKYLQFNEQNILYNVWAKKVQRSYFSWYCKVKWWN